MKKTISMIAATMGLVSASAFAAGGYSAIAFDKTTGHYGRFQGAYSEEDAVNNAVNACVSGGGAACQLVGWAYDGYVVLAIGTGNHFGTGNVHDTQSDAEQSSLAACNAVTTNCHIALEASAFDY